MNFCSSCKNYTLKKKHCDKETSNAHYKFIKFQNQEDFETLKTQFLMDRQEFTFLRLQNYLTANFEVR